VNRPTPREAPADSLVLARRGLRETARKPTLLVLSFIQPVIPVLILRFAFGGAIQTPNGSYELPDAGDPVRRRRPRADDRRQRDRALAWLAGLLLVCVPLAVSRYRALE
jgi:hypothetical protein